MTCIGNHATPTDQSDHWIAMVEMPGNDIFLRKQIKARPISKYLNINIPKMPAAYCNCPTAYTRAALYILSLQEVVPA